MVPLAGNGNLGKWYDPVGIDRSMLSAIDRVFSIALGTSLKSLYMSSWDLK